MQTFPPQADLFSLRSTIDAHPWTSVAIAFLVGACAASHGQRSPLARKLAGSLGMVALAALRDAAMDHLAAHASSWLDARVRPHAKA